MRDHRLIAGIFAAVVLGASPAGADETIFDFVAARPDQEGAYAPGAGAVVSGGVGTLLPIPGWLDEAWRYRRPITVVNGGAAPLAEWPILVPLDAADAAGADVWTNAEPTGADLRLAGPAGMEALAALAPWDPVGSSGGVWFQAATVPAGATTFDLYYGNAVAGAVDDPEGVFSYGAPYASRYLLEPAGAPVAVASMAAANDWTSGAVAGTLGLGGVAALAAADWVTGQTIAALAPFEALADANAGVEAAPLAFAATLHSVVVNRGTPSHFTLLSPFADTTVTVAIDGATATTVALTAGVAGVYEAALAANAIATFTAPAPILVAFRGNDLVDSYVLVPPATELWGFRSGTPRLHAPGAAATVTVWDSTGAAPQVVTVPAGGFAALTAGGSGTGEALRLSASAPITVVANGDGDGGDAMTFHPRGELGRSWVVPTSGRFVLIATTGVGATCTLTPPDGSPATTASAAVTVTPPYPGRVMFGTTTGATIQAGSVVRCDAHGFAYYEDAVNDDERNLYPMEAHRKRALADPVATLGGPRATRYRGGLPEVIDTPDLVVPTAVVAWNELRVATLEPAGTNVSYLVSLDQGASWLVPGGSGWTPAVDPTVGATAQQVSDAFPLLATASGRLRVRAILRSVDGVTRPSVDAIRVFYESAGAADRLSWGPVPATVMAGKTFSATISALDAAGTPLTGLNATVALTASHGGAVIPATVMLSGGAVTFDVAVGGVADDVTLTAVGPGGIAGTSVPFDLVAPDGAGLELVSGDGQFGTAGTLLAAPLTVRAHDAGGGALAGVQVTFAVTAGGGVLEPGAAGSIGVVTGADGTAQAWLRLGTVPGPARVRAEALGVTLELVARGDVAGATPPEDDGGGCGCRVGAGRPGGGAAAALGLLVCGWALTRRLRR